MSNISIKRGFSRLYSDGIRQEQPSNSYSHSMGVEKINDNYSSDYVSNERGNAKFVKLPAGIDIRGEFYVSEDDYWLVLAIVNGGSEIGMISENGQKYTTLLTDDDLDAPIGLKNCVWTKAVVNRHGKCRFKIYFQTDLVYRVIEINNPCCGNAEYMKGQDTNLMKATSISSLTITSVPGLGNLPNGSYRASLKVFDQDSNDTNFSAVSKSAYVADKNYRSGEEVGWGIVIEGYNLPVDYNMAELVIMETVGGLDRYKVINNIGYGENYFRYTYTGAEGVYVDNNKLSDVLTRVQHYFRGEGIADNEGSLFLFNVEEEVQFNIQKDVNKAKVGYINYLVPAEDAHLYPSLKKNENYVPSLVLNFIDGRKSQSYPFINTDDRTWGTVDPSSGSTTVITPGGNDCCPDCGDIDVNVFAGRSNPADNPEDGTISIAVEVAGHDVQINGGNVQANSNGVVIDSGFPYAAFDLNITNSTTGCTYSYGGYVNFGQDEYSDKSTVTIKGTGKEKCECPDIVTEVPNENGNCTECMVEEWMVKDTSKRTKVYPVDLKNIQWEYEQVDVDLNYQVDKNTRITCKNITGKPCVCSGGACCSACGASCLGGSSGSGGCTGGGCGGSCSGGSCTGTGTCSGGNCSGSSYTGVDPRSSSTSTCPDGNCGGSSSDGSSGSGSSSSSGGGGCSGGNCGGQSTTYSNTDQSDDQTQSSNTSAISKFCNNLRCNYQIIDDYYMAYFKAKYNLINTFREYFGMSLLEYEAPSVAKCGCSEVNDIINTGVKEPKKYADIVDDGTLGNARKINYIKTDLKCPIEGVKRFEGQICYQCMGGYWNVVNNVFVSTMNPSLKKKKVGSDAQARGSGGGGNDGEAPGSEPDYIEGPKECYFRRKPIPFTKGLFGYWETENTYPEHIGRDDCKPIFGEYAGKKESLFKVPSLGKESHFISNSEGVPSKDEIGNDELQDSFVIITGFWIEDLRIPKHVWPYLDPKNPYSIHMAFRGEKDKTVISNGLLHGTFGGEILGEEYLFAKHGANAFEFIDVSINPNDGSKDRRGYQVPIAAYTYHSPDYHLYGNKSQADYCLVELLTHGQGHRHGLYSEGEPVQSWAEQKVNQAGARYGISLNKYLPVDAANGYVVKCIKKIADAPADSIVGKGFKGFTRSLVNLYRESSQYVEFDGAKLLFDQDAEGPYTSKNGGDHASDTSVICDGIDHSRPLKNNQAHMVTMMKFVPNQYGSLISRVYVPTGIEAGVGSLNSGTISGWCGDSYVGAFSYKRTAYLSNNVDEDITPSEDALPTWFDPISTLDDFGLGFLNDLIKKFLEDFLRNIGYEDIGTVPKSGNAVDPRNLMCLRPSTRGGGQIGPTIGDKLFYQVAKGYIHTFLCSDANLNYRGTGNVLLGDGGVAEVHRRQLKGLNIDASMPDGSDHERSWLGRFSMFYIEPSRWKMIRRLITNFIFTYGIGFYLIFTGLKMALDAVLEFSVLSLGIPTAVGFVFSMIFVLLGVAWIKIWANQDLDNRVVDKMIGMEFTHPDKVYRNTVRGDVWQMNEGRVKGFEDNYWYYNTDFSRYTIEEISFGMPNNFDPFICHNMNKIVASLPQVPQSNYDSWRQFKPNHYAYIPRTLGKITNMFNMRGRMYVHTTDTLLAIGYSPQEVNMTQEELILGRATIFGKPYNIFGGIQEGWGGCKDPNASRTTPFGHFFVDRDARRLKKFSGSVDDVSLTGVEMFYDDNMLFKGSGPYDQRCKSGSHYDIGMDYGQGVLYFYKQDGNDSFLISLDMKTMSYLSHHQWRPEMFLYNRFNLFSIKNDYMWRHHEKGIYSNFYDTQFPVFIEMPFHLHDEGNFNDFEVKNIKIVGEVLDHGEYVIESDRPIIDKIQVWNGRQSTGWRNLRPEDIRQGAGTNSPKMESLLDTVREDNNIRWQRKGNGLVIEELYNIMKTNQVFDKYDSSLKIYDTSKSGTNKNGVLEDDFQVVRIFVKGKKNTQFIFRKMLMQVKSTED